MSHTQQTPAAQSGAPDARGERKIVHRGKHDVIRVGDIKNPTPSQVVGEVMREWRADSGLSIRQFAALLDIDPRVASNVENGHFSLEETASHYRNAFALVSNAKDATIAEQRGHIEELRAALGLMIKSEIELEESGDAGSWDVETQPHIIKARAALSATEKEREQ